MKKQKKQPFLVNFLGNLARIFFLLSVASFILPFCYNQITRSVILKSPPNKEIKVNYNQIMRPTSLYLNNDYFLGQKFLVKAQIKSPLMQQLYETNEMNSLKSKLNKLILSYPKLNSSVFVWDIKSGNYVDINANMVFPAASIIKIPILIEMFKLIEQNKFSLYDKIELANYFRTEGSGDLQYKASGSSYTIDELARKMIQDSDNTATNMILSVIGGKPAINSSLRQWGFQKTYVENWLADLNGTNTTTAREMATILYNTNNNNFLTIQSQEKIAQYMGNVKNNRLLKAGLPPDATIVHKTGDIGTMLGDAGIVYTTQGQRYIVVILSKRPHNHPDGKDFIVKASKIIYDEFANSIMY